MSLFRLIIAAIVAFAGGACLGLVVGIELGGARLDGMVIRLSNSVPNCNLESVELRLPRKTIYVTTEHIMPSHQNSAYVMFLDKEIDYSVVANFEECPSIFSDERLARRGGLYLESIRQDGIEQTPR